MTSINIEFIKIIDIPELSKGLTTNNCDYFIFSKNRLQLLSKKAPVILALMGIMFLFSTQVKNNFYLYLISNFILVGLGIWYFYEARFMSYYKNASIAFKFRRFDKMMEYLNKILNSKRTYFFDMPLVYSILKAKQLLLSDDISTAENLIDNILKINSNCTEAYYIKGLCRYFAENLTDAQEFLSLVVQQTNRKELNLCAKKLLNKL